MHHEALEDYALLADQHTGPLVSRQGSLDWLCLPRFDSPAVFAAILGTPRNGRWLMRPTDGEVVERGYLYDSFVLRTLWRTPTGEAEIIEFMPQSGDHAADLIRMVRCTRGEVSIHHELLMRFEYGLVRPWVRRTTDGEDHVQVTVAGGHALALHGPMLHAVNGMHQGDFTVPAGRTMVWTLTWFPSWQEMPPSVDAEAALAQTLDQWRAWGREVIEEHCDPAERRSFLVLRALTHHETGGIVAAPTASLPETIGGGRNWDYRYAWLRDSAMTIEAFLARGHGSDALRWRDWLLRAIAGDSEQLRVMYTVSGDRLGPELELAHLKGYRNSSPVRVSNAAADQYQADVVGEVMVSLAMLRDAMGGEDRFSWGLQKALLRFAESNLERPDHGIWEMRGDLHLFTHSRVMLWAAFDRGVRAVQDYGLSGDVDRWRALRDQLHAEINERGFNTALGSFTQSYEDDQLDAALLVLPQVGFLAWDDPRMLGTVARLKSDLIDEHGLLLRYRAESGVDGLSGAESPFLLCNFWLVIQYANSGRLREARQLYDRLTALGGDLHLLAEEYDPVAGELTGNYPQAFSHLGLVQAAHALRVNGALG